MPKVSCKTHLELTEQEVLALKHLLDSSLRTNIEKFGLSTFQIELLKEIHKFLPDWSRAYNTDEELENAYVPD